MRLADPYKKIAKSKVYQIYRKKLDFNYLIVYNVVTCTSKELLYMLSETDNNIKSSKSKNPPLTDIKKGCIL